MQSNMPEQRGPAKDNAPRMRKGRAMTIVPLMLLFIAILAAIYLLLPKELGKPFDPSVYKGLMISEVMSANAASVPDENGEFGDWLEIYNGTGADLDMEGVMLTKRTDRITFPFPSFTLKAGLRVIVFASNSYQLDAALPFHGKFKISSAGDHLYLYDPNMCLIDEVVTPAMTADQSYILTGTDENGTKQYALTDYYSPGFENTQEGFTQYRSQNTALTGALIINELCPNPKVGIPDEDNEIVDWLELRNTANEPISLEGYYLSDRENKPMKWRFPDSAVISANGYYLVYCSGKDKLQANGVPHTNFSINAERETVVLSDENGRLADRVSIENVQADYSIGRDADGNWTSCSQATPGTSNDANGQSKTDQLLRAYNPTGVCISEVMASNDTVALGTAGLTCDYLELYNSGSQTVDLSSYGLSNNLKRPRKWQFPQGTIIAAGEYKVIYLDGDTSVSTVTEPHTNFKLSRAGGDTVSFCDPGGRVLDRIPLSLIPTDHSYGRAIGYAGFYYYNQPTPGAANGQGYYGYANNPSFSQRGGEYKGSVQLTITIPRHMAVYYTLDGSIPTENSASYSAGDVLDFNSVTVLRALAFDPSGMLQPSDVITQTYLLNLYHTLPLVSIVADPDALWDPENGLLTVGPNVDKSKGIPFKNTIYRMAKEKLGPRSGYVEMYLKDGTQLLNQGMEFGLQGQNSLDFPQKSFKVKAKANQGSKYFSAKLFEDRPFTAYKGFVLRISGNDSAWTRFIDGFQGRLIDRFNGATNKPSTVIHQAWRPVAVYLNGVYWGHYNLRERVDRYFVAQHEGLPLEQADKMDILEGSGSADYGSNKEYKTFINKVGTLAPGTNEEDLQYILDRIDIDNYIDYMAFEMFFGNSDPGNIRFYKLKGEGSKWKWILYDMDYGLFDSGFNSPYSYLKEKGAGDQLIDNTLIRKLLENDRMRDRFLTRLGEIFQYFTTEYMTRVFNEMAAEIEPEMTLHFNRWAEENDKAISYDNPATPEGALRYWHTRLDRTRNVLKKRPTYFYEMVQKQFQLTSEQMLSYFGEKPLLPADAVADYMEGEKWK